ncbi:beta-lactamase family protein [Brucepastera parasyntrophica]|uniref:serine hydrolase domain-containing protein n=1 Tax=Brucepastera parasyntrophica TaxID=2880008 RepID=UPI0021099EC1|nr:serine hydrolase domain-containing protein [Brucepastera parasyntrophica]ULQ58625.1 beta-lactamase family protein [Brucepastera parasyntrophica]
MNIENLIGADFSGIVSVRKNKEVLFEKAFGYADLANKNPNTVETKFPTASAGKVFVATRILQLIEKGHLSFDTEIGAILSFDLDRLDQKVTVEQLLTHTSGVPDYFDESELDNYADLWKDFPNYKIRKSTDLLPLFIHKPMMYRPGEKFQYNNSGFVLLGIIIEEISKKAFDTYLDEEIFQKCNMNSTGYYELDRLPGKCASAYIYDTEKKEYYSNIYSVDAKGSGAGGAYTTIPDIHNFWKGLLSEKLISEKFVKNMLSVHIHDGTSDYGYGIWLNKESEELYTPYFQGSDPGVSFISSYNMKKETEITLVSNMENNVWEIKTNIEQIL